MAAGPGVAYVIGPECPERAVVAGTLREATGLAVVWGPPSKQTLIALGMRNVKLIAVAGECLEPIGFRNEFRLRCGQPKLAGAPVFVYGSVAVVDATAECRPLHRWSADRQRRSAPGSDGSWRALRPQVKQQPADETPTLNP